MGCPGIAGNNTNCKKDKGSAEILDDAIPRSEKLQLEGVVTDIANVNKFVKKYDKSVHYILGGPF